MARVLIVYATDYGNTKKMAEVIADGARSVKGTNVVLKTAEEAQADDLTSADAVIVGSPVHMGSPDWRIKKFIDTVCSGLWMKDAMNGKVGAVFATGSGFGNSGGGNELTLVSMLSNFAELGMVIIPLPKGTPGYAKGGLQWGPYGRSATPDFQQTGVQDESLEAAKYHGIHVARAAEVVAKARIFG